MMARKIRCNDEVVVLSGRDKGKRGKVRCLVSAEKAIVSGINIIKKHQKPSTSLKTGGGGGIIQKEAAINISNLAIYNSDLCKPDRIGFRVINGKKVRVLKSTGKILEY